MSLALKRTCPFTLTIYQNNDIHTSVTMDPDPYAPRFLDRNVYNEWRSLSPSTDSDTSQRSPSPPKRPRNTKNLSLNVPSGPQNSSAAASAPASPFRSPRFSNRRPPNLTINIHSLHRHPSTPELHTSNIVSPFVTSPAPYTASQPFPILNLDTRRNDQDRPKPRHTDPLFSSVPYGESVEREKAYPDGPRLIIEPNIWLYAEPDLELAKTYDVVVNVAREVGIPFIATETLDPFRISPQSEFDETSTSPFSPPSSGVNPSPSVSSSVSSGLSPQLPLKATETVPTSYKFNDVEYMHIPWDHNSSLTQDLPGIVDYILERSEEGKKILVHCQCGVSRSATLVIALVMKKFGMGTHEAYAYVKDRSPWIGPNMSLIYQLTDYGRLCGYERKPTIREKIGQTSAPTTAPLESSESRRYKDKSPKTLHSHLSRTLVERTQSQDRPEFSDVDGVTKTLSSPQFVVSKETEKK